jgi:hypothetical protein
MPIRLPVIPIFVCAAALACLFEALEPSSDPPLITGTITYQEWRQDFGPRILIEEQPGVMAGEKVFFAIHQRTTILVRRTDGSWRRGDLGDLQIGALASGWSLNTLILDSYPRQPDASHIAVVKTP